MVILALIILASPVENTLDSLFYSGEFGRLLHITDSLLSYVQPDSILIPSLKYRAYALSVLGDTVNAVETFKDLLEAVPDFRPDPALVPPVVSMVFEKALREIQKKRRLTEIERLRKEVFYFRTRETMRRKAFARALIFPGFGHSYLGYTKRAHIFELAGFTSIVSTIFLTWKSEKAHEDYLNEIYPDRIESKYRVYKRFYMWRNISAAVFGFIYLVSAFDVLLLSPH